MKVKEKCVVLYGFAKIELYIIICIKHITYRTCKIGKTLNVIPVL